MRTYRRFAHGIAALALIAAGCSQGKTGRGQQRRVLTASERVAPLATSVTTEPSHELEALAGGVSPNAKRAADSLRKADAKSRAQGVAPASQAVHAQVVLKKAGLFDRTFLYGFDLQYSSAADAEYSLVPQSQALGHLPATFRRMGNVLQLLGDQSRLFESDINHPEILINEYRIVAEDDDTLSVVFERGGHVVNEGLNGKGAAAPKQTWVRSFQFIEQGNYLLQETGLLLADGSVETILESVFPRDALVPADYKPLYNDRALEPLAERYRFLSNETVYLGFDGGDHTVRLPTQVANRYNLGADGTIDWYVTPNIPDKFLPAVKSGIEGWNRYFEPQLGRKAIRFLGRLPDGVKIGDPRFNVVNWDSVEDAGAAYESQAADPTTGIQSHSLIYLPYAWYNIGADLWHRRVDAGHGEKTLAHHLSPKGERELFGEGHQSVRCVRALEDLGVTAAQLIDEIQKSGNGPTVTADEFGTRILISTLFHEVGHALGLAHNFKGSLSFDGTQPVSASNPTTSSIMDYNYYMHELGLFGEIGSSDGHALEYDRQIISQLYNAGKDVKDTDAVIAACDDTDADKLEGGVDPLCNRYDSESDPAAGVKHAYDNIVNATGAAGYEQQTLTESLAAVEGPLVAKLASAAAGTDAAAIKATAAALGTKAGELVRFYVAAGAQSLRGNIRTNDKALRVWIPDALAAARLGETDVRSLYSAVFFDAATWRTLPATPKAQAAKLADAVRAAVIGNPGAGADDAARETTADAARTAFMAALDARVDLSLTLLRQSVHGLFAFAEDNPFALRLGDAGGLSQFEEKSAATLAAATLEGLATLASAGIPALADERLAAAAQLATFKGIDAAYDDTVTTLKELVAKGRSEGNQNLVDQGRKLIKVLGG